ncbi:YfhO family protein [Streptomyces sp. NPDC052000]|uniref:YfhO family protein n=1 Tax=Streptomyces sp. NPDC052000 TaxID=3155676 RepID=UPI00344C962B
MLKTSLRPAAGRQAAAPAGPARPGARWIAPLASALGAMGAYCLATAARGTYPFGERSRAVNDLGNQFVPFHAHLWDLVHGQGGGDLLFNWNSGYGVPFLADFLTYLMNPFSWLVVLFSREGTELGVFLVTLLSIGLGTALMTVFLGRLRPGSPWLRAVLAVGYGMSGWTTYDGWSDPMWLWGLVSFPLIGIATDWCLQRRRWPTATLLVAACWAGNFYTAAMATLGMGLILMVRLLLDARPTRDKGRALLRALTATTTGILLAAPVVTVPYLASRAAQPPPDAVWDGPPDVRDYLAHLLPGGYYTSTPRICVGVLALLLVLTFPFMGKVARRERAAWCALAVLVALSYTWRPTVLLWHGLALPNGSPYRAAIALTAILVSIAWLALARRPSPRELLMGSGLLALLLAVAAGSRYVSPGTWILTPAALAASAGLLCLLHRHGPRTALLSALACTVLLGTAGAAYSVSEIRDRQPFWQPKTTLDANALAARELVRAHDTWPTGRSETGPHEFADNDPLLLGAQGASYYSSYVPARTAQTLHDLGAGWEIGGRHLLAFTDPVGRAIMGVTSHLESSAGAPHGFTQVFQPAPPVVTLRPPGTPLDTAAPDPSVFARRNRVLGAPVYSVPALTPAQGPGPPASPETAAGAALHLAGGRTTAFTARCAPGTAADLYAPWYAGTVRALGATLNPDPLRPMANPGLQTLGTVPADGTFTVTFDSARTQDIPRTPVGCLDRGTLDKVVATLKTTAPARITAGGHSIDAAFRPGTNGTAVIAVPAVDGWRCQVDGGAAKTPGTLGGLIAVRLGGGGSRVACSYHTPGLKPGLVVSGLALATLLAVAIGGALRTRTRRSSTGKH